MSNKTPIPINLDGKERVEDFLNRFDYILSDCDGVLYVNDDAVPGASQALNKLRALGKKVVFATNNSTKTREEQMKKLKKLGYEVKLEEVFTTSFSTAIYLNSLKFNKKAFVIGMDGISQELDKVGIESFGVGQDPTPSHWTPGMCDIDLEPGVGAVVVGFDNQISFPKLARACSYAKQEDCLFICANPDESFPTPRSERRGSWSRRVCGRNPGCHRKRGDSPRETLQVFLRRHQKSSSGH